MIRLAKVFALFTLILALACGDDDSSSPDSGTADSGMIDAGARDSGTPDSGTDSGGTDAGDVDGGDMDASAADGSADGSMTDSAIAIDAGADAGTDAGTLCSATVVDISSNDSHCGACDNACTGGEQCVSSVCTCVDPDGDGICAGLDACPELDDRPDLNADTTEDCTQTPVMNSQFTEDVSGWTSTISGGPTSWQSSDALDNTASGSLRLTNNRADLSRQFVGRGTCVEVSADTDYTVYANYRIPDQGASTPRAGFGYFLYDSDDCTGNLTGLNYSSRMSGTDAWAAQSYSFSTGASTQSIVLFLTVDKVEADPAYAEFDNVLLAADPG